MDLLEIQKKLRHIEFVTSHLVENQLAGLYRSVFKGQGMQFKDFRSYDYGDDTRHIHWLVSARLTQPVLKTFEETREQSVLMVVDCNKSSYFQGLGIKHERILEMAALIGLAASKNQDRVGLLTVDGTGFTHLKPHRSKKHLLSLITQLYRQNFQTAPTDLKNSFEFILRTYHRRTLIFLLSDFYATGFEDTLKKLAVKHDIVPIIFRDPREYELPTVGRLNLRDPVSGKSVRVNTNDPRTQQQLKQFTQKKDEAIRKTFALNGIKPLNYLTIQDPIVALSEFFKNRMRSGAR